MPLTFREIQIDGTPIDVEITPTDAGLRLHLPQRILAAERVELHFAATVFQNSTRFRAFLERENGLETYRQQVDPGNAVPEIPGAGDAVSLPVDQVLLTRLDIGVGLLTPNGDGINDALEISFDVLKVIDARPIEARICDLHGRLVRTLKQRAGRGRPLSAVLGWSPQLGRAGKPRPLSLSSADRRRLDHSHSRPQYRPQLLTCGRLASFRPYLRLMGDRMASNSVYAPTHPPLKRALVSVGDEP